MIAQKSTLYSKGKTIQIISKAVSIHLQDLVNYKRIQIMYKAKHRQLPQGIQRLFKLEQMNNNLTGTSISK